MRARVQLMGVLLVVAAAMLNMDPAQTIAHPGGLDEPGYECSVCGIEGGDIELSVAYHRPGIAFYIQSVTGSHGMCFLSQLLQCTPGEPGCSATLQGYFATLNPFGPASAPFDTTAGSACGSQGESTSESAAGKVRVRVVCEPCVN